VRRIELANELAILKLKRSAGQLVPLEQVKADWFRVSRQVRDSLLNLPSRLSGIFAAEPNQNKIFAMFTREIHNVLTELSSGQLSQPVTERRPLEDAPEANAQEMRETAREVVEPEPQQEAETKVDRFTTGD
jgi:NADPH:quinone reductase-like Zn-dependent oxidoreductase